MFYKNTIYVYSMKLTADEQAQYESLVAIRRSSVVFMTPEQQKSLEYLTNKQWHNCCINANCTGYETEIEEEINCPKCGREINKM